MSKTSSAALSNWLKETPALSIGARAYLAARLRKRAIPFIPICAFGFALDEAGPEMNGAPARVEPGR